MTAPGNKIKIMIKTRTRDIITTTHPPKCSPLLFTTLSHHLCAIVCKITVSNLETNETMTAPGDKIKIMI
jgi:hypothetical protein